MKIDWNALLLVAGVSILASVVFIALLAVGIRQLSASQTQVKQGSPGVVPLGVGWLAIGLAGLLVVFGLYLIVPQFH